jgi:hypothetical protein
VLGTFLVLRGPRIVLESRDPWCYEGLMDTVGRNGVVERCIWGLW